MVRLSGAITNECVGRVFFVVRLHGDGVGRLPISDAHFFAGRKRSSDGC